MLLHENVHWMRAVTGPVRIVQRKGVGADINVSRGMLARHRLMLQITPQHQCVTPTANDSNPVIESTSSHL